MSELKYIALNNEVTVRGKDGFFQLEKDKEAVIEFAKEVKRKMVKFDNSLSKVKWLVENDFYYPVFNFYTEEQVAKIYEIAYSYEFKFQSFMAISKFYQDYAMKTNDLKKYLEYYEDRVSIVSLYLAEGNYGLAELLVRAMMEQRFQPATPTFLNAGKSRRGEMVSCFLLEMDDSLNSINYVLNTCMQLSKIGGGVAVNLSKLRSRGEAIKGVEGAAKGIMPVLKLLEDAFSYADQMGQRKGSGAGYYNIFGADVLEFLDTKKINASEKERLQSLSIGLIIPNKFYDLVFENEEFYMFYPYSVYKEYGVHLDDMDIDAMYDELVANENVKKKGKMKARDMLNKIAQIQFESGYPYIMNKTNANNHHALKGLGQIKMSNLCTEIFQLQETSFIGDYDEQDIIRYDISCNLASLNIVNVMEYKAIEDSVSVGMRALTSVTDMTDVANAPGVRKANNDLHAVGLGAMNLHGFLAKNKIPYESVEALDFANTFFMIMNYYSIKESMRIAIEKGQTFKGFEKSEYANGNYFDQYINESYSPVTEKVKALFEGIHIITQEDWNELKVAVMENGLYHAYRLAIAPTQSIGYIQNATASVMPIVDQIEARTYAQSTTYYPMPFLSPETMFFYKSAYHMNQHKVIDMVATIQRHIDQGVSAILYVDNNTTTAELASYYIRAAKMGLNSLYYTRTKRLSVGECTSCAV